MLKIVSTIKQNYNELFQQCIKRMCIFYPYFQNRNRYKSVRQSVVERLGSTLDRLHCSGKKAEIRYCNYSQFQGINNTLS